jgi:uncharacterized protein YqgQ
MLNSVRLPFIAELLKKKGFVVLFPDQSGNIYLFPDEVPIEAQRESTRTDFLEKHGYKPIAFLEIENGLLTCYGKSADLVKTLIDKRYTINYLLAHGFLTRELAQGKIATALVSQGASQVQPSDAAKVAASLVQELPFLDQERLAFSMNQALKKSVNKSLPSAETNAPIEVQAVELEVIPQVSTNGNRSKKVAA